MAGLGSDPLGTSPLGGTGGGGTDYSKTPADTAGLTDSASASLGGGGVADPASITGLINRWRADSIGQADASAVSSWAALAGSTALAQATGTNQPTYRTAVLNGQPVVRFDGTNDLLTATSPPVQAQPVTVAFVVKLSVAGQQQLFLSGTSQLWSNGTPWAINLGGTSLTGGTTNTSWHVITAILNTTAVVYDNGTQIISGSAGTNGLDNVRFQVGQFSSGRNLNGDIAEIFIYSQALNATDRSTLHSYVQDRYGITVSDYVASSGTNYTASPADTDGLTDTATRTVAAARTAADSEPLTDLLSWEQDVHSAASANAQVTTPASSGTNYSKVPADTEGLTDTATRIVAATRTAADTAGLTDAATAGLTTSDTYTWVRSNAWVRSDPWPAAPSNPSATPADTEGLTDTASWQEQVHSAWSPPVSGTTSSGTGANNYTKAPADTSGLTDTATRVAAATRTPADSLGLSDAVTADLAGAFTRTPADTAGLTDSVTRVLTVTRTPADTLGLTDVGTGDEATSATHADTAGLTDTVTRVLTVVRAPADLLGLADVGPDDYSPPHIANSATVNQVLGTVIAGAPPGDATVDARDRTAVLLAPLGESTVNAVEGTAHLPDTEGAATLNVPGLATAVIATT